MVHRTKGERNPSLGIVEFELSNPVDFEGQKIPVRQITTYCNEAVCGRYRGEVCGYTGTARFTHDGKPTDDPTLDRCSGLLAHCKLRDNEGSFVVFLPLVWFSQAFWHTQPKRF